MEAFLGREIGEQGARTSGVLISWLRQEFAQCPKEADEETVGYYCSAWILHLFAYVLFPDATGDTARARGRGQGRPARAVRLGGVAVRRWLREEERKEGRAHT